MLLKYLFNFERLTLKTYGGIAQLGEHLPCTQGVKGSNPFTSTIWVWVFIEFINVYYTFTILLVVTFLKITSSDVSIGMVNIFRFNHLIFCIFHMRFSRYKWVFTLWA